MTMIAPSTEPDLIARSIAGDRDAFAEIVNQHQSFICALTYNATGNLAQSEDLSQEIFVTAWKNLQALQDHAKLRPWLCGIARNLIHNAIRTAQRERKLTTHPFTAESKPLEPTPLDQAITHEEEALLWRSLEHIPPLYREPLILFYREQRSIQQVATLLDLSEDAVKQRLSRARKLLHEQLLSFVENTLTRSTPGKNFAVAVIVALPPLPALPSLAASTTLGVTAAKGAATAKAASFLGIISSILTPLLTFVGYWAGYRLSLNNAESEPERRLIKTHYRRLIGCIAGFFVVFTLACLFGKSLLAVHPTFVVAGLLTFAGLYLLAAVALSVSTRRGYLQLRREHARNASPIPLPAREYRSRLTLLGLPFFHIRLSRTNFSEPPVVAWIAIGNTAHGILFAFGGVATALFAVGGCACGVVAFGGMAIGLFAVGGFSIGLFSYGGLALGYQSFGGCAIAWNAAMGAIALAHTAALGTLAYAPNANTTGAEAYLSARRFFHIAETLSRYALYVNALWAIPLILWNRAVRKTRQNSSAPASGIKEALPLSLGNTPLDLPPPAR